MGINQATKRLILEDYRLTGTVLTELRKFNGANTKAHSWISELDIPVHILRFYTSMIKI
jgi:hypothetical protein